MMYKVVSRLDYPITVTYDGGLLVISPKMAICHIDPNKLGEDFKLYLPSPLGTCVDKSFLCVVE